MSVFAEDYAKEVEIEGEKFQIKRISVGDQYKIQETAPEKEPLRAGILMVVAALKSWTVKGKDGKVLPISEEIIKKFRMDVMNKLTQQVLEINGIKEQDLKNLPPRPDSSPKVTS